MKDNEETIKKVIELRKKYFKKKRFKKYNDLLDSMEIPEKFNYLDCIPSVFSNSEYDSIKQFQINEYNILYKDVKRFVEHSLDKIDNLDNIILLVHPFYPGLRHANFLIEYEEYYNKYLKYEKKIEDLLRDSKNNIVLFESPDNFARYTYNFLEFNSIKEVVFTEHSTGKILTNENMEKLQSLKNKEVKICGCYGNNCIKDVELQLQDLNVTIKRENELILERAIEI